MLDIFPLLPRPPAPPHIPGWCIQTESWRASGPIPLPLCSSFQDSNIKSTGPKQRIPRESWNKGRLTMIWSLQVCHNRLHMLRTDEILTQLQDVKCPCQLYFLKQASQLREMKRNERKDGQSDLKPSVCYCGTVWRATLCLVLQYSSTQRVQRWLFIFPYPQITPA